MSGNVPQAWRDAAAGVASETLRWPVDNGHFGRGFGFVRRVRHEIPHLGVDVGAPAGSIIRAANDGIVIYSDDQVRGYGNIVILLHPDGASTLYAHCRATYVFAGQQVVRGQSIAEVGATGLAQGNHLHFEWRVRGRARAPERRFVHEPAIDVAQAPAVASL
ncbi:MAG: M23 family metallopeptidase [Sandaracinaceae bacterium]|nr:M23 family metallopeptidase [Sandaracinaceae bacterium]